MDFRGESKVSCRLTGGPARDFNVMTQRKAYSHDVSVVMSPQRFVLDEDELVFAFAAAGTAEVGGEHCAEGSTVAIEAEERVDVAPAGGGCVCVVRITPRG